MATKTLLAVAVAVGVLAALAAVAADDTPDNLINCPRDDKLQQCVGDSFLSLITRMQEGDPAYDIPKADPLRVPLMPINKNAGSVLNLNMSFNNLLITNIAHGVVVKAVRFDVDKLELNLEMHRPQVDFNGKYKIAGKILWLPIWGSGVVSLKMKNVDETFRLVGKRASEDGRSFWNVTEFSSTLEPQALEVKYDNLFNGNWLLGKGANALMNSQWKVIYDQLEPITDAHFSRIMKPVWAKILRHVDLDKAFPVPDPQGP